MSSSPLRALSAPTILAWAALVAGAQGIPRSPPASHLEAVTFDEARRRLVLFGGARLSDTTWTDLNETWEWDGRRWHAIGTVADGPGPRRAHALAYDPGDRRVVLAGGVRTRSDGGDDYFDDTWTWDGRQWARGPAIPVMSGHALVYDAAGRSLLLLGYMGRETPEPRRLVIWRRGPNGWTFADSTGPVLAGLVRAAYDAKRSVLVVPVLRAADPHVWEWDGRRWYRAASPGPSARSRHALAFDARVSRVVLIGGRDEASRNTLGDVWAWDGSRWTAVPAASGAPEPRASASLVADADSGRLLLYGGLAPPRGLVSDLWVMSTSGWARWRPAGEPAPP